MSLNHMKHFAWIVALILAASCAQVVNPGGGPIDRKPPRAVKYSPDSAALNFKKQDIVIFFDEFIRLADAAAQSVVSPPLPSAPDIRVKNKALHIKFNDTLRSNTTYTINFGNAIRDITEGNILGNFQFVFSTGDYIDSLSVIGKVTEAFTQRNPGDVLVLLYDDLSDSTPYKRMPSYFSKTDSRGMFRIQNLRPGTYKAFALKDANQNYLYDQPGEQIGFLKEPFIVDKKNDTLNMVIFEEIAAKNSIKKTSTLQYGKLMLALTSPAEKLELQPVGVEMKQPPLIEYSAKRDTVIFWYTGLEQESLPLRIVHNDKVLDTATYRLIPRADANKGKEKFELTMRTNISKSVPLDLKQDIHIVLNHPVTKYAPSRIILTKGKDTLKYEPFFTDSVHRKFRISYPFASDSTYRLTLLKGAFEDMFGLASDTMNVTFRIQSAKFYGTAKIRATLPEEGNYILQLMSEKEAVLEETVTKGSVTLDYPLLKPGSYKLKIIYDTNGNNKWDTGSYMDKRQPESVGYYPGNINVRSNWDLDLEWKLKP
jgi:uncharacterized protein (DUF2141 family)